MDSQGDRAPMPNILPERCGDREHGRPPQIWQKRRDEENKEVRQEPSTRRDRCAVSGDLCLVVEETGYHENRNDERREHTSRAPT